MNWITRLTQIGKPVLKSRCPLTKEPIEPGFGYLLTTAQIISSRKFWDMIMTESETLSYTQAHFKNDTTGTHMRSLIFEKHSSAPGPWLLSDTCIGWFDIDRKVARELAQQWWHSGGKFIPANSGSAVETLDPDQLTYWKTYAILEAGREYAEKQEKTYFKPVVR